MHTIYDLKFDPELLKMQEGSLNSSTIGLRNTHGLIGSAEWWQHIHDGDLPIETVAGTVIHFSPGHHGDWPEFEMRGDDGESFNWGCMVPSAIATTYFQLGNRVAGDFVCQQLKTTFNGSTNTTVITAI